MAGWIAVGRVSVDAIDTNIYLVWSYGKWEMTWRQPSNLVEGLFPPSGIFRLQSTHPPWPALPAPSRAFAAAVQATNICRCNLAGLTGYFRVARCRPPSYSNFPLPMSMPLPLHLLPFIPLSRQRSREAREGENARLSCAISHAFLPSS